jgi:hypothetical protein
MIGRQKVCAETRVQTNIVFRCPCAQVNPCRGIRVHRALKTDPSSGLLPLASDRLTRSLCFLNDRCREATVQAMRSLMAQKLTMVYWKGERFWLGKLLQHPEIMTQGETLEELEENLKDAFRAMAIDEVPKDYKTKEIAL